MMTNKEFFKAYRKHLGIAKRIGFVKGEMISELRRKYCPFYCSSCRQYKSLLCLSPKCFKATKLYGKASNVFLKFKTNLIPKMLRILKAMKWR